MATVYNSFASQNLTLGNTVVISKPSGVVDGDAMIAIIAFDDLSTTIDTVPSGWTAVTNAGSGGGTLSAAVAVYRKIASSEGSGYTWGLSANKVCGGVIMRFTQTNETNPVDVAGSSGGAPTPTTSFSTAGVTPTVNNGIAVGFFMVSATATILSSASGQAIATNNPTWTEIFDDAETAGGNHYLFNVVYALRPETTATGNYTATTNANFIRQAGGILFVKRIEAQSFSETVTMNDTFTNNVGFVLSIDETVTSTDTLASEKEKTWATQNKSTTTWTNQDKS